MCDNNVKISCTHVVMETTDTRGVLYIELTIDLTIDYPQF